MESVVAFESGRSGRSRPRAARRVRKNASTWEVNGSKGSIAFDLERLNELQVHVAGSTPAEAAKGSEPRSFGGRPPVRQAAVAARHIIGWEHTFVHELHHLLTAICDDGDVAPHGATLEDGDRAAEVRDAMLRSAEGGGSESVTYR